MTVAYQMRIDLGDAFDAMDAITMHLRTGKPLVRVKQELRRHCDRLHELCVAFESAGLAEEHEETYLTLFDALSHFTAALRWPGVNVSRLALARDTLAKIKAS